MPNNIIPLHEELADRATENAELAAKNFAESELTDDEKERLAEIEQTTNVAVVTTDADGNRAETDIEEYADGTDGKPIVTPDGVEVKGVNTGDIVQTVDDLKAEARSRAVKIYRDLAVDDEDLSEDDILKLNDLALEAVKKFLHEDRLDSDKTIKKLTRLPLSELVAILPPKFVSVYATSSEIKANNYKAKERLITTLAYLMATGPELDYLNDYIDKEHRLMEVSRQIMMTQGKLVDAIKSEEKFGEIVKRAAEIAPPDNSVWARHISMPNRVHNEFAQRAVVCDEYRAAYEKLLEEYPIPEGPASEMTQKDYDAFVKERDIITACRAEIQVQIDESATKAQAYRDVTDLKLLKELWDMMAARFKADRRTDYKALTREAINAVDRIRRAKQNVPFPVYDKNLINRPEELYRKYLSFYPKNMETYNKTLKTISGKDENAQLTDIALISVPGFDDATVWEYYSMLLVILFGRVMKKLGNKGETKYDAIMLDCYFRCFCTMATDIYMMTDIWNICKEFVVYCIDHYPKDTKKKK